LGIATVYRNIKSLVEDGWLIASFELSHTSSIEKEFVPGGAEAAREVSPAPGKNHRANPM